MNLVLMMALRHSNASAEVSMILCMREDERQVPLHRDSDNKWLDQLAAREVVVAPTAPFVLPKSIRLKGKGKLAAELVLEDRR